MKQEEERLFSWKENLTEAAKSLNNDNPVECAFKIGFTLQGIMIALAEIRDGEDGED